MSERIPLDAYYTPDILAVQLVRLLVAHHDIDATHRVEEPHAGGGTDSSDYVWVVWEHAHEGEPVLRWLDWRSP